MKQQESTIETTVSPIVYLIKNYADYNLWANATLVNWLRTKPEAVLQQQVPSSFPGIKATIIHIWNTQRYWLSILNGSEFEAFEDLNACLETIFTGLVDQSDELADFIDSMNDNKIEENTLVVSPWFQCDLQNFEYIMQVINHSTYHRGQIVTIGRNLGFTDAPMTDYNFYNIHGK
jgi:uncharacterized damage-inducible protein DinB